LRVAALLNESEASSKSKENELFADEVQRLTKLHIKYSMFLMAKKSCEEGKFKDPNVKALCVLMTRIFAMQEVIKDN